MAEFRHLLPMIIVFHGCAACFLVEHIVSAS